MRYLQPNLYRLASNAAKTKHGDNTIAKALLRSLPSPKRPFSGGWLFEYALESGRNQHPTISRRWSYRRAWRIPDYIQQDQGDVLAKSESGLNFTVDGFIEPFSGGSESSDSEIGFIEPLSDESDAAQSHDVKMEDDELELAEIQDVEMEDDY